MNILNKKGICPIVPVVATKLIFAVVSFQVAFGIIGAAAAWHIPAWEQAKDNHSENAYQSQEMFPQQWFDKLPGGTPGGRHLQVLAGNGGILGQGNSGSIPE